MKVALAAAILAAFLCGFAAAQQGELLGPLNTGVNTLLQAAGVANRQASRVVPVVDSVGVANGFAQIVGPSKAVSAVKAVLSVQTPGGQPWSITALVPVTAVNRGGTPHRAYGVAIDALIDRR